MRIREFLWRRWHRLHHQPLQQPAAWHPASLLHPDGLTGEILATRPVLERLLSENILPFWYPQCLDLDYGGYRMHHDRFGRWLGPAPKHLIAQARTTWFFSHLARSGRFPEALAAARHGFEFLRDHLRDAEYGGVYWAVSEDGTRPVEDDKRLIGQVYALYAAAEYALASGDATAAEFANDLLALLEARYHDHDHGGYHSRFSRAWTKVPPPGERVPQSWVFKTVNEHMHVLEALTTAAAVAADPVRVRERLLELILIVTGTTMRKTTGTCSNDHLNDWTPVLDREHARVSYGHDVESTWLVLDACRPAGISTALVADWCRSLLDTTIRWGCDPYQGGVYAAGPLGGPADVREKVWWVQAEVLVGGLTAYRMSGDARFARLYLRTLEWVAARQADWAHGDWHSIVMPSGENRGDKAGPWTDPYHQGRAVLRCLALLEPGTGMALSESTTAIRSPDR